MKKTEKGILKNLDKFNDIKLAKGIDMTLYATKERKVNWSSIGISTKTFGDKWIITPKGRGLFKTFDDWYSTVTKNVRMLNELLCQELCKQVGIRCATYEPAEIDGLEGLVTYDFVGKNKLVPLHKFIQIKRGLDCNLLDCVEAMDIYSQNGYSINKKQAVIDLYKILIFDTLTLQTDRNENNINFLFEPGKKIKVADLIDNEFAFCGERMFKWLELDECEQFTMEDIVDEHVLESKIFTFNGSYVADTKRLKRNIEYITFYAKKHPALMTTLKNMLDNLNPTKAFMELKKQGVEVNPHYQNFVKEVVDYTKNLILTEKHKRVFKEELNDVENIY